LNHFDTYDIPVKLAKVVERKLFAMLRILYRSAIWTLLSAGAVAGALLLPAPLRAEPAPAEREQEIAYCDTEEYAIKIFTQAGNRPSIAGADAMIRIYDRSDNATFINRTPVSQDQGVENGIVGTVYENLRGENQWQLFIARDAGAGFDPESPSADPNAGVHQCILSRDGDVMAYGEGRVAGESVGGGGYYPGDSGESEGGTGGFGGTGGDSSRPSHNQD
jgi:hypothetical protein